MSLTTRIDDAIGEIDLTITRIKALTDSQIADLQARRAALVQSRTFVTPELEKAVTALESVGIRVLNNA